MQLSRRDFLGRSLAAAGTAALPALLKAGSLPSPTLLPMARRPNVLYIIMEDVGPYFSCYGEPLVRTPNVDRLASEGILFNRAFCTAPVCSSSRSALMTGAYQTSTGTHHHRTWAWNKRPLPAPVAHVCDWFRAAGYHTSNLRPSSVSGKGVASMLNGARGSGKIDLNFSISHPRKGDPFDGNDWSQRAEGQPFFAHITLMETHKRGAWERARKQPKAELVDPDKLTLPPYYPDHPVARDEYANLLDVIHLADGYVGELMDRLEREGLADDTVVVFSSDHGSLFRGKQFLYDGGLRIPLIVRFPDRRNAGAVDERLASGVDLAPTLLGFAGVVPPPGAVHGFDLFSPEAPRRDCIFAARDRMDDSIDRMRAVRTERFKYIRNALPAVPYMQRNAYKERNYPTWNLVKRLHKEGTLTQAADLFAAETKPIEELYDLQADPHEVRNLAAEPAFAAQLREMRGRLDKWLLEYDRASAYEDPVDVYRGFHGRLPEDPGPDRPNAAVE